MKSLLLSISILICTVCISQRESTFVFMDDKKDTIPILSVKYSDSVDVMPWNGVMTSYKAVTKNLRYLRFYLFGYRPCTIRAPFTDTLYIIILTDVDKTACFMSDIKVPAWLKPDLEFNVIHLNNGYNSCTIINIDSENNKATVMIQTEHSTWIERDWNLEHTILGFERNEYRVMDYEPEYVKSSDNGVDGDSYN